MSAPAPRVSMLAIVALTLASLPLAAQQGSHAMLASAPAATPHRAPTAAGYYSFGFMPGERVADVSITDVNGKRSTLAGLTGTSGAVLVIRDAECPVTQRYSPRLAELEKEFGPKGYNFAYVDVTPHSRAEAKADAEKYGLTGRTILDEDRRVVNALRASSAAEAFVIDARGNASVSRRDRRPVWNRLP